LLLQFDISFSKFIKKYSLACKRNNMSWSSMIEILLVSFFVVRKVLRLLKDITFFLRRVFFYLNDDRFLNLCQDIQNAKKNEK
jgi:hypothetical protein